MVVGSQTRSPVVLRKGCPAPAEILFKRSAEAAGVSAGSGGPSSSFSAAVCGGGVREDRRIPVRSALRVLRRVGERSSGVASQSVASESVAFASCSVESEFECVASASLSVAYQRQYPASAFPAISFRVPSTSQAIALGSARGEWPSSTLPLVLKSLARRAAAAKVSRRQRRLEHRLSCVAWRCVDPRRPPAGTAWKASEFVSRGVSVESVALHRVSGVVPRSVSVPRAASEQRIASDAVEVQSHPQCLSRASLRHGHVAH